MPVELDAFIAKEMRNLIEFGRVWRGLNDTQAATYPLSLENEADWLRQYWG